MTTIEHTETLAYYEGAQVFAGQDQDGNSYIGAMIDAVGDSDRYLVTAVASIRLQLFRSGGLDLRTLMLQSSADGWYTALVNDDFEQPASLTHQQGPLLAMDYLPEAGFRLRRGPEDALTPAKPDTTATRSGPPAPTR